LGEDALLLTAFHGQEEISRLFHYELDMLSENEVIAAKDLVGQTVRWCVQHLPGDKPRYFHGIVSRFAALDIDDRGRRHYRAEVVPQLWLLTRSTNCRIFQKKTVPEIIEAVFEDFGITDYKLHAKGAHPKREYCVQYRETAFSFLSRLMEEEGIGYFFFNSQDSQTLILADLNSFFVDCAERTVEYHPGAAPQNFLAVTGWEHRFTFPSGKWSLTDYNFETPDTSLLSSADTVIKVKDVAKYERFDYPGGFKQASESKSTTRLRMEEEETPYNQVAGRSLCCTFLAGGKFELTRHTAQGENQEYLLTSVRHEAVEGSYEGNGTRTHYRNEFTCIPSKVAFRPARITPRPVVQGPQPAVVVGPNGEEIYTDKYGRVKVQFFWDRLGKKDENSSCWIRVTENWAGKNWGMIFTPRIGQEVIVEFLEGDPDRPLVTGRVYNAQQMPPYELPANQTQSGIKTRSSRGGGAEDFNELRFEDEKDKEDIYFHAQKDFHRVVEHDDNLKVGHDQTVEIKNNRAEVIKEGDEKVTLEKGQRTHEIKKDDILKVDGNHQVTVKQNDTLKVDGKHEVTIKQDDTLKVDGSRTVKVAQDNALTVSQGNYTLDVSLGKVTLKGMQGIELKVGGNSIVIDQSGIKLSGTMIKIEGKATAELSGAIAKVEAKAIMQVKGALTMIG
jgi:type VI secretion system secreted protein VgrG